MNMNDTPDQFDRTLKFTEQSVLKSETRISLHDFDTHTMAVHINVSNASINIYLSLQQIDELRDALDAASLHMERRQADVHDAAEDMEGLRVDGLTGVREIDWRY